MMSDKLFEYEANGGAERCDEQGGERFYQPLKEAPVSPIEQIVRKLAKV
jgi:hypothetical protein